MAAGLKKKKVLTVMRELHYSFLMTGKTVKEMYLENRILKNILIRESD